MNPTESDGRLEEMLLLWEEAWEQGEDIPAEQLCSDCPDLVASLGLQIQMLKKMLWMTRDIDADAPEESPHSASDPLISKTLGGRYRIDALVAEGGFGRVYRGFDPELDRPIAIKVAKARATTPSTQLHDEARRVAKLRHPGIVPIHDVGRDGDLWFFVSDLIEGRSLAELARKLAPSEAADIVAQVADALQHAHEQGFVHQDIKPSNILMDETGRPQVTDFGIAVTAEEISDRNVPRSGTLPYMAPEQLIGEVQLIGPRTDIYALGTVLFELLTGRGPYQARTAAALREQIIFRAPLPPRSFNSKISAQLEATCLRCLAKHPADRFDSAAELAAALRSCRKTDFKWWPLRSLLGRHESKPKTATAGAALPAVNAPDNETCEQALIRNTAADCELATRLTAARRDYIWRNFAPATRWLTVGVGAVFLGIIATVWMMLLSTGSPRAIDPAAESGVFSFDGRNRIITPLESFAPCTLEAWIKTTGDKREQYIVGSDFPGRCGIGIGINGNTPIVETIPGGYDVALPIPPRKWTHLAAAFGTGETVLFLNGKKVGMGPATEPPAHRARFVLGNLGEYHYRLFFTGHVRSVRISRGIRYAQDFRPEESFSADPLDHPSPAILIYDGSAANQGHVVDLSGNGNHGTEERVR